ncbi:aldehyde dehydrogenase family protein [Hamadaea tsunoensis]|uniref:aldehyde dehydrogenase family protein n=1 Tax=Hamadaea tsunoensis TaxID=53368 RepID=UPI0004264B27|nr:aldehyde dehydrogenase family protein [Hamadaea tsunoensis]
MSASDFVNTAVEGALDAAPALAAMPPAARRDLLHAAADALAARGEEIIKVAADETGLTTARLTGELDRTTNQLRLLGDYVAAGRHLSARVSPEAGLRQIVVPIGPVAVFAASNFPLAFGILGGDTGSALAAGCPVVVKAHPAQPLTSRLLAEIVTPVFPPGFFTMIEGGADVSLALVAAPGIQAVGFTGSLAGGRALMDTAAARPQPIPVYAEMGAINPVFVLPGAAADRTRVAALAAAVTGSAGQLCTKPGLVIVPDSADGQAFAEDLAAAVAGTEVHRLLTDRMAAGHADWVSSAGQLGLPVQVGTSSPAPVAVIAPASALTGPLLEEHFGPAVVIATASPSAFPSLAGDLEGQLTATVHASDEDHEAARVLLPVLATKAGRIIWNGVPTGVAVVDAMLHGGPWPATSAAWSTSVGTAAVERFQRPVALQNVPADLL